MFWVAVDAARSFSQFSFGLFSSCTDVVDVLEGVVYQCSLHHRSSRQGVVDDDKEHRIDGRVAARFSRHVSDVEVSVTHNGAVVARITFSEGNTLRVGGIDDERVTNDDTANCKSSEVGSGVRRVGERGLHRRVGRHGGGADRTRDVAVEQRARLARWETASAPVNARSAALRAEGHEAAVLVSLAAMAVLGRTDSADIVEGRLDAAAVGGISLSGFVGSPELDDNGDVGRRQSELVAQGLSDLVAVGEGHMGGEVTAVVGTV